MRLLLLLIAIIGIIPTGAGLITHLDLPAIAMMITCETELSRGRTRWRFLGRAARRDTTRNGPSTGWASFTARVRARVEAGELEKLE